MAVVKQHHELHSQLASIVSSRYVSDDDFVLLSYTRDASICPAGRPQGIVVRPGSIEEVVDIVRLANQTRTPIVPQGGKASIAGVPPGQPGRGIIVDMKRMDKVLDIDEPNQAVTAQCGISLGELAGILNEKGWDVTTAYMPHYVDTLGGQICGVPGAGFGMYGNCFGYNWHYLLGMKVVLPDATVLDTGTGEGSVTSYRGSTWARGSHGPDLTGLFTGDAGVFGIKVEATYRIFRLPKFQKPGRRVFDTIEQAYEALYPLWEIDPFLYMQPYSVGIIYAPENMKSLCGGKSEDGWSIVFLAIGNTQEEVELKHKVTDEVLEKAGGKAGIAKATEYWFSHLRSVRDMGRLASRGPVPLFELYVSRRDALEAIKWTMEFADKALKERGIGKDEVTHLMTFLPVGPGQGMTSTMIQFDPLNPVLYEKVRDLWTEFLWTAAGRGYIIEGPQGHEARMKSKYWSPEFSNFMMALKKMMDPNNIMNPGLFF
jgi:glycolate oxidase